MRPANVEALRALPSTSDHQHDFRVNTAVPGPRGKFVTSRKSANVWTAILHNVALRVEPTSDPDKFVVFAA